MMAHATAASVTSLTQPLNATDGEVSGLALMRSSLGRTAAIGDLYDARSDTFCGVQIFTKDLPEKAITELDDVRTLWKTIDDNTQTRDHTLESHSIDNNQRIIIWSQSSSPTERKDTVNASKEASVDVWLAITTKYQKLKIPFENLEDCICQAAVNHESATHVVVGVQWGGKCRITVKSKTQTKKEKSIVENKLKEELSVFIISSMESSESKSEVSGQSENRKYTITLDCDFFLEGLIPKTIQETFALLKGATKNLKQANDGRGKPCMFTLLPLADSSLNKFRAQKGRPAIYRELSQPLIAKIETLSGKLNRVKKYVSGTLSDIETYQYCLKLENVISAQKISDDLEKGTARLQDALKKLTHSSSNVEYADIDKQLDKIEDDTKTLREQAQELYQKCEVKLEFAKLCSRWDITYIGRGRNVECELRQEGEVIALFLTGDIKHKNKDMWDSVVERFLGQMPEKKNPQIKLFVFIDCDFHPEYSTKCEDAPIERYLKGKLTRKET